MEKGKNIILVYQNLKVNIYDRNNNIIYELKEGSGFVKEYSLNGQLIFDGKYINGLKNEKGKEYHPIFGKIIFDGEYALGKRWNGLGKEYDNNGNLICEIKYLDGQIIKSEKNLEPKV